MNKGFALNDERFINGNIYSELELNEDSTSANYKLVQKDGNRENTRNVLYYNLDMVISVGHRTNPDKSIQFRRLATYILKEFSKNGYVIDKNIMAIGDDLDILKDAGKISHEIACDKALTEFEKYRIKQDKLYESDFDNFLNETRMIENGSDK